MSRIRRDDHVRKSDEIKNFDVLCFLSKVLSPRKATLPRFAAPLPRRERALPRKHSGGPVATMAPPYAPGAPGTRHAFHPSCHPPGMSAATRPA